MFVLLKTQTGIPVGIDTTAIDCIYPYGEKECRILMRYHIPQDMNCREENYVMGTLEEVIAEINRQAYPQPVGGISR